MKRVNHLIILLFILKLSLTVMAQTPAEGGAVIDTLARTQWLQYSGNPIIKPGTSGWNQGSVYGGTTVIMFKDTLRMWYMGTQEDQVWNGIVHIGYAWSLDGINWHQYSENPVFSPRQGEWDYPQIIDPFVIADGDTLRMWYGGGNVTQPGMRIGYATSVDGIDWNRLQKPIIEPPQSPAWDQDGVFPGGVIKEDGIFKMWFSGGVGPAGYPPPTSKWSIGYATSSDCIHWDLLPDPVVLHGDNSIDYDVNFVYHASVIRINAGYDMWYTGYSKTAVLNGKPPEKIGYASSADGINWTKYYKNPVLGPTSASPQWTNYTGPSVYFDGERFHIWYSLANEFSGSSGIGYAASVPATMLGMAQPYIDRTFARKNEDSVLFRTTILNFSIHHFTAKLIYTNLENTLTDSLTLYDDGLHGDSEPNDGIYGVYIPPLKVEDDFMLNVSTTEDSTNKYINAPISQFRFTTAGPIKLDSLSVTKVSSTAYTVKPFFKNEGASYTVNDLKVKISTVDNRFTIETDTISISSIAPGATAGATNDINISASSRFSGVFNLNFEIMSDGWTYWTDKISQAITGIDEVMHTPINYNLFHNYPNPFNPSTIIKYQIPASGLVTLKIYDILGNEVATLVNEEKAAGIYKIKFNASNLASGVYFYRITARNFFSTKKFILLK
jgi:predicted GH43/DUF377 family glycosyl hydrolase